MNAIKNILGVARYERKMLLRTTKFRILGGIGVAIPLLQGIGMAVAEANGVDLGSGLDAYIPFYTYSYLQAVVIAFIVGDFRAADERASVYEVVAARPISTAELVMGKYLGVVGALFTLSLGVLLLALAVQAAKISITKTPFTLKPYLIYLLLMNLPALIYMSAVTFFLGSLLRRQTAVTLITIAYGLAVLFFLGRRYGGIYDFGAFFAPLFYSDLLGLGDVERVIDQRFFYLALALCFFGLSIERYPRLPQSAAWTWFGRGVAVFGLAAAAGLYVYMDRQDVEREAYRAALFEEQTQYAQASAPEVVHYDLQVDLMADGTPLQARARMQLKNAGDAALDTLIFSLNPGLTLRSVYGPSGAEVAWRRKAAVIRVSPGDPLAPGGEYRLTFVYEGEIDRDGFDLFRQRSQRRLHKRRAAGPFDTKGDLTAWIRKDSAFLPPRSRWYPVPGVDYGHTGDRPVSFATADIVVWAPAGLEVVTQGRPAGRKREGDRERTAWKVERPVPFFSLNAGTYEVFKAQVHGLEIAFYLHPAHRKQVVFFEDAKEEVLEVLDQMLDSMEQETGLAYPYPRLSVVEVPFQVQWYYEGWQENGGLTQPGVLMVEEDVLMGLRLRQRLKRMSKRQRRNDDPARLKRDLLVSAIFRTFFSREGSRDGVFRSPVAQLWSFDKAFRGENFSLLKRGLPLYMQEDLNTELQQAFYTSRRRRGFSRFRRPPRTAGTSWDTLVVRMQQRSFSDVDPAEEADLYRAVLDAKGPPLFRMIEAVVGDEDFREVLKGFEADHRYGEATFASFEKAALSDTAKTGGRTNLSRLLHDWLYDTHVPGYTLTRVKAYKVDDDLGMMVYQVVVRIRNGEPGRGFVQIRVMGREDEAVKGVEIEGGQEVEVGMILWDRPFRVMVEPFFARNRRPLVAPLRIPEQPMEGGARSYVREVTEEERTISEIIVDNDDEGFSMPIRRVQRYLRPELKGDNWKEGQFPFAFGRYETTYRWKRPGDGAQPAVWTARLPHGGDYDVAFYTIPRWKRRKGATSFTLRVSHSGKTDTLKLETGATKGGWHTLGRFRFEAGEEARVELSDLANGRVYADAVRWRYVDPEHPDEVYEEDVPTWTFGGRGRGGRGRGGRGGGMGRGFRRF